MARSDDVRTDLDGVFRQHYVFVVAVATRILGSQAEAEDVAQDVFLSFVRSTVPADEARSWLGVASAHTALNAIRARKRRAAREEAVATDQTVADVADAVITNDERARVRRALGALPRKQAVALVLRHSGLGYAEVAAALGLSPASVGTTIRRAEAALREELDRDAPSR